MRNHLLIAMMFALAFTSCSTKESDNKTLILYYSQTGTTEKVAQELQTLLNADIEAITLENPYSGTYSETIERVGMERESGNLPALIDLGTDLSQYDTIFLGYPIWYGTYAMPIASLVNEHDFSGKNIVTFCTFGSGGLEAAIEDLKEALPDANIAENGFGIRTARVENTSKELYRFMVENNYIEGSVEALPGYSEMRPVTDEERQIFDAACGNYQFPLGTPVLAGKRGTPEGVDYIYEVDNNGTTTTIYITVDNTPDAQPQFTRVVR